MVSSFNRHNKTLIEILAAVRSGGMDAQTRKAMYREKLREKEKKRIDSPLLT